MIGYRIGKNKELVGSFEIETNRFGDPMIPGGTVLVAPPKEREAGYVPVWNGTSWELKEDLRGTEYWDKDAKWGDSPKIMEDLGSLPEGAILTPPAEPTKEEKWKEFIDKNYKNLTKEELRNKLYQNQRVKFINDDINQGESEEPLCFLDDKNMSVDEAKQRWLNYYGDDNEKAEEALNLSLEAKNYLRKVVEKWHLV